MNKYYFLVFLALSQCFAFLGAKDVTNLQYFKDSKSDEINVEEPMFLTSSILTKVYSLDMLFKTQESEHIFNRLSIDCKFAFPHF